MAETTGKRITDLPVEESLDNTDVLVVGSNGTAAAKRTTLLALKNWLFGNKSLLDRTYPVNSIYMSVGSTSPATLFGGTWVKIEGRFLLGTSSAYTLGKMDGAATVALAEANIPSHSHTGAAHTHTGPSHSHTITVASKPAFDTEEAGSHSHKGSYDKDGAAGTAKTRYYPDGTTESTKALTKSVGAHKHTVPSHTHTATCETSGTGATGAAVYTGQTGKTGSGTAHNNMPPYLAVNIWKRTA